MKLWLAKISFVSMVVRARTAHEARRLALGSTAVQQLPYVDRIACEVEELSIDGDPAIIFVADA